MSLPPADMAKFYRSIGYNGSSFVYDKVCEAVIKKYQFSLREASKYLVLTRVAADKSARGSDWPDENNFCNLIVNYVGTSDKRLEPLYPLFQRGRLFSLTGNGRGYTQ